MKSSIRRVRNQRGAPIPTASGFYGLPGMPGYNADDTYMRSFGRNGTIFSIVTLFSESTAQSNWHLYRKHTDNRQRYAHHGRDQGSDQRTEVIKHPALDLWNMPNPWMPRFTFVETFVAQFELTGKCFWIIDMGDIATLPLGMWPVTPSRIAPIPSDRDFIAGWIYTGPTGEKVPLTNDEVIWMRRPSPIDPYDSVGAVQTVLTDIDAANYSSEYNRNFFINNAIPGGILAIDGSMSETDFIQFSDEWRDQHLGVSRAHRVAVLENTKAQFLPTGITQKDMDFVQLQQQARDKMREAWRVHKHMLGSVDDVNRANAQTAEELFAAWGETPRLERIKLTLNTQLLPKYKSLGETVEFDYDDPVPVNREADVLELKGKAQAALWLIDAGYYPDDVAEVVGLPPMQAGNLVEEGDLPPHWVPHSTTTVTRGGGQPSRDREQIKEAYLDMEHRLRRMLANGHRPAEGVPLLTRR